MKKEWSKLKSITPNKYRFMTGLILNNDQFFELYEKAVKQRAWLPYSPISVSTFYEVTVSEGLRGYDYTESEINKVYQKKSKQYDGFDIDAGLSSEKIQEKYDRMIVRGMWIGSLKEFSKGKDENVKELAKKLLQEITGESPKTQPKTKVGSNKPTPVTERVAANLKGIPKVEDIILRTATKYGLSGVYVDNEVSILFSNGEILTNPISALDELDIQHSKSKYPKRWNTWVKKNNVIYVTKAWKGKTYDWKKWFKLRPAGANQKLVGRYNTSDAFGGATVINASTVNFDAQGRFAWKTIKGGDTSWKPIYSKNNSAGTYELRQNKITLNYNNGAKESFFFGFYPKSDDHFVIGSNHFVPITK